MQFPNFLLSTCLLLAFFAVIEAFHDKDVDRLLIKSGIRKGKFDLKEAEEGKQLVSNLDDGLRGLIVLIRRGFLKYSDKKSYHLYLNNWKRGKIQIPSQREDFPCPLNNTRSVQRPISVHQLRPGDIDVIAAIGDSLSAGNGIYSKTFLNLAAEFRGMAFSGGGMANWRTVLTLPNILKIFNPNLYGFATDNVLVKDKKSYFNIAEPMIMSRDLVYQVQLLIERLKGDPKVDMKNDWKLLTIFVGSLDLCFDLCHSKHLWDKLRQHEIDLIDAFTLLRDNVPRLLVNLLPAPNMVTTLGQMRNVPLQCKAVHLFGCRCVFSAAHNDTSLRVASEYFTRWQAIDEYVASLPAFQTDDFAVLYQPFMANAMLPLLPNGDVDLRFFSSDCFHFSQLGHAAVANALWNNMLQMPGQKDEQIREPFQWFECPSVQRPYIATLRNSISGYF
ncbi:phospholipase B1, membrane-associated-like [Musca domestica]|uniref:Phospholipase B1, membrane-associated n=1 Tax=Musca domestica TaxID=7370 RepID=A0A1I8N537_MUSDO|nr:phospholipase B1, membrane-associated-like [Musca domestica]